jgi:hypothetical protein
MKTVKTILTGVVLFLVLSASSLAQSEGKVIAVINKADWCPVCKANGARAMSAFMANNKDGAIVFVGNNLTNDETKKKSSEDLRKYGLDKVMSNYNSTGVAYFFNPVTKSLISEVSLSESDDNLAKALQSAKSDAK